MQRSWVLRAGTIGAVVLAVSAACSDNPVSGPSEIHEGVLHPNLIEVSLKTVNTCNAVFLARKEPLGYVNRAIQLDGIGAPDSSAGPDRLVQRVHYTRFEVDTAAVIITEADCAVAVNSRATQNLAAFFKRMDASRFAATRSFADGGRVDCYYYPDSNTIECDGEYCSQLWAQSRRRTSATRSINDTFRCSGSGCTVYGTAGYTCDGGGGGGIGMGGGDGGGGGGSGGGTTEPTEDSESLLANCPDCEVTQPADSLKSSFTSEAERLKAHRAPGDECYDLGARIASNVSMVRMTDVMWAVNGQLVGGDSHPNGEPLPGYGQVHIALNIPTNLPPPENRAARPLEDLLMELRHEFGHIGGLPQRVNGVDPAAGLAARCR